MWMMYWWMWVRVFACGVCRRMEFGSRAERRGARTSAHRRCRCSSQTYQALVRDPRIERGWVLLRPFAGGETRARDAEQKAADAAAALNVAYIKLGKGLILGLSIQDDAQTDVVAAAPEEEDDNVVVHGELVAAAEKGEVDHRKERDQRRH